MTTENPHVEPLETLVGALAFANPVVIEAPIPECAQITVKLMRRPAVRILVLTLGADRVMWTVIHDGVRSLYGDHRRGRTPMSQIASAITATIDRSFAQP